MSDETLTGKLVAGQPNFGVIHTRAALEGSIDDPSEAIEELGWDGNELQREILAEDAVQETIDGLTTADVPPPREEADHEHVLVIGEFELQEGSVSVTVYDDDDIHTRFIGKDLAEIAEK